MADDPRPRQPSDKPEGLSPDELRAEQTEALPDREALSTINASFGFPIDNFAMPINEATALNINSNFAVASADADQIVIVDQASDGDA